MKKLSKLGLQRLTPRDAYGRYVSEKRPRRVLRRRRYNPVLSPEAFSQKVRMFQQEIDGKYIGQIIRGLRQARRADLLPDGRQVNEGVKTLATIMASSGDVELADKSRLDDDAADVVDESLGFVSGGIWSKALEAPEAKGLIEPRLREMAKLLETLRIPALSARKELGLTALPAEEDEDDLDAAFAEEVLGEEAEEPEEVEEVEEVVEEKPSIAERRKRAAEKAKRSRQSDGRVPPEQIVETVRVSQGRAALREDCKADLETFKRFEATRRSAVRPSAAVLDATKKDVLLFMLQDRTTQVWAKGAITVTFAAPGQGLTSIQKAASYAKIWRECKKSRHECRIVVSVEGSDEYLVKAPALQGPASTTELLDLAAVGKAAGISEKSNPRRNRARQVGAAAFWPKALRNLGIRTPDRELASFIRNPLR